MGAVLFVSEEETAVFIWSNNKVSRSNFISTVIFNFEYVFFLGIHCHFIKICLSHWVSATEETLSRSQKRSENTLFVTNLRFLYRTDSVRQTSFKEMAKNTKKGDVVKIEIHSTKKIRLGYI